MNYSIGDKFKIKKDLNDNDMDVVDAMLKHRGKIATVIELDDDSINHYRIDLDGGIHYWTNAMIEPLIKEYKISDMINSFEEKTEFINSLGTKYRIQGGELYYYDIHKKKWVISINGIKVILNMKFTKVEQPKKLKPMTFEEAVRTGKRIKYCYDGYTLDKFHNTQNIFKHLVSPMYGSKTVSEIILEGTWYAEGVYE